MQDSIEIGVMGGLVMSKYKDVITYIHNSCQTSKHLAYGILKNLCGAVDAEEQPCVLSEPNMCCKRGYLPGLLVQF